MNGFAKIKGGELYKYLKNIDLYGRLSEDGTFVIYGCPINQENVFFKGLLEYDRVVKIYGFKTICDVENWFLNSEDGCMQLEKDCIEFKLSDNALLKLIKCENLN